MEARTIQLALRLGSTPSPRWELARQLGVEHAVLNLPNPDGDEAPWSYGPLRRLDERVRDAGLSIEVVEERPPMDAIRLGRSGRERELQSVLELVRNMGKLDIPVWCWSWRTHFPVFRTGEVAVRGGSRVTAYDHAHIDAHLEGDPRADDAPQVSKAELWENLEWFLERVVPVAEEAGVKLALHPDDPPIDDDIAGTARIATSVENFDRVLSTCESEYNGVCLGQGNFAAMGVDVPEAIRHFGEDIHFVHFRDTAGPAHDLRETWHDNGPTDMRAAMEAYREVGFDGPIRPDHFPEVTAGEGDDGLRGRLYAVGYIRGLVEQTATGGDG